LFSAASDDSTAAADADSAPDAAVPAAADPAKAKVAVSTEAKASLGGSFVITAGLDVNAGAKGTFFGLFDSSTKASLFKKSFTLFSVRYYSDYATACY
jgi:hypothetical protein